MRRTNTCRALLRSGVFVLGSLASAAGAAPLNVVLMIGDGMGPAHVEAARLFNGGPLSFESAPHQGLMTTDSLVGVTDSAAAATAMATGTKVQNTVVSFDLPTFTDIPTSLEILKDRGKSTGLVTNSQIVDATPAAFGAHTPLRVLFFDVASDYLNDSRPEVLLGGGEANLTPEAAAAAGYAVAETRAEMQSLASGGARLAGIFGDGPLPYEHDHAIGLDPGYDSFPFLSEMTSAALSVLEDDPDGFFLLVEQENTDSSGHLLDPADDKIERNVAATLEFARAVQVVLDWTEGRDDTLVLVTADHETGGLEVLADNGPGVLPSVAWAGGDHTGVPVGIYGWGPNADLVAGVIDNTDVFHITTIPEPASGLLLAAGLAAWVSARRAIRKS